MTRFQKPTAETAVVKTTEIATRSPNVNPCFTFEAHRDPMRDLSVLIVRMKPIRITAQDAELMDDRGERVWNSIIKELEGAIRFAEIERDR